jgi:two-component system chemotaxis sensor kinase CheA
VTGANGIDQYKQAFQEEARELLAELESALLELDENRGDQDVVGRAFRALHTIKGSGAMFGFDDIASFTHHLENAFDQLRKGQLEVTADLIRLALEAADQIKSMLEESAGAAAADQERSRAILAALSQLTGASGSAPVAGPAAAPVVEAAKESGAPGDWHIRFRPSPDVLLKGVNPALLLNELRELGQLEISADTSAVPPLRDLNPEFCYLAWEMRLRTSAAREAICDIFIFVEDDSELLIEALADEAAPAEAESVTGRPAPAAPAKQDLVTAPASAAMAKSPAPGATSIRVSADKLDQLINLVGELVTVQARLTEASARTSDPDFLEIAESVERLTAELRENSMSIRMLPLRTTFERFRRLVHDLGMELGKEVELAIDGADTELDKTVIDQLNDPLVHLIRNSMDHGVETPQTRLASGKPKRARIHLSALHSGAHVLIRVADDGRGLDVEAVRARAVEQGLIDPAARLTEAEVFALILAPGFSTARQVTDVSGRGVGMDVVRRNVEALHGSIEIASVPGAGCTVTLRLPLTLAIIDGLLVRVGDAHFVLPLANSLECVELTARDIERAHGNRIANVRGEAIPYIRLREFFGMEGARPEREQIMVVETEYGRYGFVVDQVLGDHQTVIKNLGKTYRNVQVVSGATILGNGSVALILDPHRLVQSVMQIVAQAKRQGARAGRRRVSGRVLAAAGERAGETGEGGHP